MPHSRKSSVGFVLSPTKRRSTFVPPTETPLSRRQSMAISDLTINGEVFLDVPENNDEKEKKERQLNRLQQQIQSRKFSSPTSTSAGTPAQGDRRRSLSQVAGLSNQQLSDHYSKCIQLSAENKISVKNAFSLQLIDYMSEMLRRKDSDLNNFQVASCTLDASTKIYAYRVDSVHTDTLKMAGGLGRAQDKNNKPDHDDQDMEAHQGEKRRRKVKKKVIETNIKNLNVAKFDLEFEVDPLFKKTACQFDEGRSGSGIFLNTLQLQDDSCLLMLDSESVIMDSGMETGIPPNTDTVQIPNLGDLSQAVICPTFATFEFTSWKLGDDSSFCDASSIDDDEDQNRPENNTHRFDVNAVPAPIDDDAEFYADDCMGAGDDDCENGTVVTIGQEGCQRAPPPLMEAVHLKEYLAKNPSEYSYFDTRLMSAWAGPSHWRMRPLSKVKSMNGNKEEEEGKRRKKVFVTLKYEEEVEEEDPEVAKLFAVTRKAIKLTQQTFKIWSKEKTTLPLDLHYEAQSFFKLFGRPAIIIQRQKEAAEVNESINEYNYDNNNDKDNYCADVDDAGSGYGDNSAPGYDVTDIFSQTVMGSQPSTTEDPDKATDFLENLVAAPNRVAKINIGYARTAKKMDMKKLKTAIWDMLADPTNNKENERQQENLADSHRSHSDTMDPNFNLEFSSLYKNLPSKVSARMSENLSVPLAFIALLHLANDHNLKLVDQGNLLDFTIMQG